MPRPNTKADFWKRVRKSDDCWEWQGQPGRNGYGYFTYQRKNRLAHRFAYQLVHGSIPNGLDVLHRCDNPRCVRPDHLWAGTHSDNMQDMLRKGRRSEPQGEDHHQAKLTWEDVRAIRKQYADDKAAGHSSLKRIAAQYGVHFSLISLIVREKIWRDAA